jgi:hypothetical protein
MVEKRASSDGILIHGEESSRLHADRTLRFDRVIRTSSDFFRLRKGSLRLGVHLV